MTIACYFLLYLIYYNQKIGEGIIPKAQNKLCQLYLSVCEMWY